MTRKVYGALKPHENASTLRLATASAGNSAESPPAYWAIWFL